LGHTKTAETIEMPFGMMSGLSRGTVCYAGVTNPKNKGHLWGKTCA